MSPTTSLPSIDPLVTPVWTLCHNEERAAIINDTLARGSRAAMVSEGGSWTGRSAWHATEAELIEDEGIKPACSCCGSPFGTKLWCDPYPKVLAERNLCFGCNHWIHTVIPTRDRRGVFVINANVYSCNPDKPIVDTSGGDFYGYGGRRFLIRLLASSEVIETNNLWHGGVIPERFRSQLPDTAVFEELPKPVGHGQGYLS